MTNVHTVPEPAIRYAGAREAFISLYEAARDAADACRGVGKYEGRPYPALQALEGQIDKAAPAYGQALVARAEGREPKPLRVREPMHIADADPEREASLNRRDPVHPLEFDATVALLIATARGCGWTLRSWGLTRLHPETGGQ